MSENKFVKNTTIDDYIEDIMFNLSNSESNPRKMELERKIKFGLQPLNEIHPVIRDLENNFFCLVWGFKKNCDTCGEKITKPVYCCDKKRCPECNSRYANRRGMYMYYDFEKFNTEYMIHKVLTFPHDYFDSSRDPSQIKKEIKKLALEFLEKVYGKNVCGVGKVHSWSTKKPLDKPHWHVHLLISDKKYKPIYQHTLIEGNSKDFIIDYAVEELQVYSENLEQESEAWRKIICYDFPVNIYHAYSNKKGKKKHWCRYIARDSIYDINKVLLERGHDYKLTENESKEYIYQTTYKKHAKSIFWFGEFTPLKRGKLSFILRLPRKNEKLKFIDICPICETQINFENNYDYARINDKDIFAVQVEEQEFEFFIKRKTR